MRATANPSRCESVISTVSGATCYSVQHGIPRDSARLGDLQTGASKQDVASTVDETNHSRELTTRKGKKRHARACRCARHFVSLAESCLIYCTITTISSRGLSCDAFDAKFKSLIVRKLCDLSSKRSRAIQARLTWTPKSACREHAADADQTLTPNLALHLPKAVCLADSCANPTSTNATIIQNVRQHQQNLSGESFCFT